MADAAQPPSAKNLAVYIVFGIPRAKVNDRILKLLRLRNKFDKIVLVTPAKQHETEDDIGLQIKPIPNPAGVFRQLGLHKFSKFLERVIFFPSPRILFVLKARRRLLKHISDDIAQGKQVCLLTCAPPHDIGFIGLYIKRRLPQLHWVIDWQDLWSYDENYYYSTPKLYRQRLKRWEQRMLQTADMNITTNAYAKAVLEEQYGVPANRCGFIHHHFDHEDAAEQHTAPATQASANQSGTIKLGFLGTLFKPPRVPGDALAAVLAQVRAAGMKVELHVHGLLPLNYEDTQQGLNDAGVFMHGPTSHEEAVKQLANYDYLVLLLADLPNCKVVMSIKLPHYLMMGKPILAIVPERSAIADIVTQTGAGAVIPTHSDWSEAVQKILRDGAVPRRDEAAIRQFDWDNISLQWLKLLSAAAR